MKWTGLPARMVYAVAALLAGFAVGFCATVWLLPVAGPMLGIASPAARSEELFRLALSVGAIVAVPAFLCGLTLPWRRRRHRRGRARRLAISAVIVVLASLVFAGAGHSVGYDLLFTAWLSYTFALTYVRYGLLDQKSSGRNSARHEGDEHAAREPNETLDEPRVDPPEAGN
jgi:hypothetical protein